MLVFHGCRIHKGRTIPAGSCITDSHERALETALTCVAQGQPRVYYVEAYGLSFDDNGFGFLTEDAEVVGWHRVGLDLPPTHWSLGG